jgi:hypothetical protein
MFVKNRTCALIGIILGLVVIVLIISMTTAITSIAAIQPLVPTKSAFELRTLLPSNISSIDIMTHINSSRQALQDHNTTVAVAQLDTVIHEVSRVTETLWSIHEELLGISQHIKGLESNDIHGNNLINTNQAGMEPNSYNALVNIIMARQDIITGNVVGAQIELDGAAQAVKQFSNLLKFTAYHLDSINSGWSFNATG